MSEFQKAAEKAADDIYAIMRDSFPSMERSEYKHYITKHFSDLEATYAKLVELATIVLQADFVWADMRTDRKIQDMMIDPQVQAAIGGVEGC